MWCNDTVNEMLIWEYSVGSGRRGKKPCLTVRVSVGERKKVRVFCWSITSFPKQWHMFFLAVTASASASSSASLPSSTHRKLLLTPAEKHLLPPLNNFSHWSITLVKPCVLNFYLSAVDSWPLHETSDWAAQSSRKIVGSAYFTHTWDESTSWRCELLSLVKEMFLIQWELNSIKSIE